MKKDCHHFQEKWASYNGEDNEHFYKYILSMQEKKKSAITGLHTCKYFHLEALTGYKIITHIS